jgi:hypothetical protein
MLYPISCLVVEASSFLVAIFERLTSDITLSVFALKHGTSISAIQRLQLDVHYKSVQGSDNGTGHITVGCKAQEGLGGVGGVLLMWFYYLALSPLRCLAVKVERERIAIQSWHYLQNHPLSLSRFSPTAQNYNILRHQEFFLTS